MSGVFFSNFLPPSVKILQDTVQIDNEYSTNYVFEKGAVNDVYPDLIPYRFVLDQPTEFTGIQINPNSKITLKYQTDLPIFQSIWHIIGWIREKRLSFWGYN